jgi:hypothetical protein
MLFIQESPNAKLPKAKQIQRGYASFQFFDYAGEDQF